MDTLEYYATKYSTPMLLFFFFLLKYTTTKKTLRSVRLREKKIVRSTSGLLHPGTSPTIWSMQYPACSRGSSFFFELTLEKNIHNDPRQNVPCEKEKIGKPKIKITGKSHLNNVEITGAGSPSILGKNCAFVLNPKVKLP